MKFKKSRRSNTTIAALMVDLDDADGMLCGLVGRFESHVEHVREAIGLRRSAQVYATLNALMLPKHTIFVTDAYVNLSAFHRVRVTAWNPKLTTAETRRTQSRAEQFNTFS